MTMDQSKLKRRDFLRLAATAAAGAAAVACQPQTVVVKETVEVEKVVKETVEVEKEVTTVVEVEKEVTKVVEKEKVVKETVEVAMVSERQSPMFQERVKAGELAPLEERLPVVPGTCVDVPAGDVDLQIGQFGGTMRMVHTSPQSDPYVFCINNESLLRCPGLTGRDIVGNVCKGFQMTDGGTVLTLYMREGMKWSDGAPCTTEDILFTYEDVLMNEEIVPNFPQWLRSGNVPQGAPMDLEVLDDYTFRITFAAPYGGFPVQLAINGWRGHNEMLRPKHYMTQFHADYTPLADLEPMIAEEGFEKGEWGRLFQSMSPARWAIYQARHMDLPKLNPWRTSDPTTNAIVMERNPYYFKVDAEGKQLPYIDGVRSELVQDAQMAVMKIITGEVDFVSGGAQGATVKDLPVLKENESKGDYRVVVQDMHVTPVDVFINQTYDDPVWRQVVRDVRFRKALSLGIDRAQIVDAVYNGFAQPASQIPSEYDPDSANALLDEVGLDVRDDDGWRLGPDGVVFDMPFEISASGPDMVPVTELIVEFWKSLGLNTTMKVIEGGLRGQRQAANELKISMGWVHATVLWFQSDMYADKNWGILWHQWMSSDGETGEEPPDEVKRYYELLNNTLVVTPDEALEIEKERNQLLYDNIFGLIIVEYAKYPTIAKSNMRNVPTAGFAINSSFSGEQFFFEQ
jgi:peptide/nickel transport system substrate-binding protein